MTSVRQSHVTTMSTTNHDNNLDALLEELQTSVSRPGSSLGHVNGPVTGYREVTRTVTTETDGHPTAKTSEYQIEYLNPSNTTTVLKEVPHTDLALLNNVPGRNIGGGYKTVQYEYRTTTSGSTVPDAALPVADARMRQNITELDSLLDDLHTAQKTGFADSSVARNPSGIDPGLLEPIETSTPKSNLVSHSVEEHRYGSVGGRASPARDREVRRELVFTGGSGRRDPPSPALPTTSVPVARQEVYRYESKTTRSSSGTRDLSPPRDRRQPSPSPARQQLASVRQYNYSGSDEVPRTPTMHRSPSPASGRTSSSTTVRQQQYNYNRDFSPEGSRQPLRSPSPSSKTPRNYPGEPPRNTSSKVTSVNSYSYNSSSRDTRTHEVPRSPPPHRSPSPVSFTSPPLPSHKSTSVKSYFEQTNNAPPYVRPQSPQPVQKFSPSDPSRTLTYQVSPPPAHPTQPTVITYKYSSQTTSTTKYPGETPRFPTEESAPLLPRPFPTPSPTPEHQQQPPKKLDELMASFGDTEVQHHHETSSRYMPVKEPMVQKAEAPPPSAPQAPPTPPPTSQTSNAAAMQVKSKNISGPPVYYPPGVELFAKKEEMMTQSQSGGGKYKAKAKYEYESSSKMKSKESSGKTVVPVCLPVCCAMPCVIM